MFVKKIHDFLVMLANQGQSRYIPPEDFNVAVNNASLSLFRQEYKQFERSQELTTNLGNFKKKETLPLTNGNATLPVNYLHATNAESIDGRRIDIVEDGFFVDAKSDPICPPDEDYPICRIYGNIAEVLPEGLKQLILYYVAYPEEINYSTTISTNGRDYIFDESSSTDTDWPKIMHPELAEKTLTYLGVVLNDQMLTQFEALKKQLDGEIAA